MASSRGAITDFCTVSADAPGYAVITITVGGAMSGNCSIGRVFMLISPTSTMTMDITAERTGRSMNVLNFILYLLI